MIVDEQRFDLFIESIKPHILGSVVDARRYWRRRVEEEHHDAKIGYTPHGRNGETIWY